MKLAIRIGTIAVCLVLVLIVGIRISTSLKKKSNIVAKEEKPKLVRVFTLIKGNVREEIKISGTIHPHNEVEVYPKLAGRITAINRDVGDVVKAFETLAIVEHKEIALQEQATVASLAMAKANEEVAYNDLTRSNKLFLENAIAKTQLEMVQLKYDQAHAQTLQAKAHADIAHQQVNNAFISSLIAGTIVKRYVNVGASVSLASPVFSIQDISKLKLTTSVDAATLRRLHKGMKARLMVDQFPKQQFLGEILTLSPSLDAKSRRAFVEINIGNTEHKLIPNMFVHGVLVLDNVENVLIIPNEAINASGDKPQVFKVVDGKVALITPALGVSDHHNTVVIDSLKEGDQVVVSDTSGLYDGLLVTIEGR